MERPKVGILMGSESDLNTMQKAAQVLQEMEVAYEMRISSAHRAPDMTAEYARTARERGLKVIICGAGMAAHLAGAVAAQTTLPVIGVPLASGALSGLDALYATVQMPSGIPVATVAIDGAGNAAYLACQILAVTDEALAHRLEASRQATRQRISEASDKIGKQLEGKDSKA
jgi:5-(carboxyamino)imidazole ribonucleotide mutase